MIRRFNEKDTRTGNQRYSGWHVSHDLCNGVNHFHFSKPCGVFARDRSTSCVETGECDLTCKEADDAEEVEIEDLSEASATALGIFVLVPDGKVLVKTDGYDYSAFAAGEKVAPIVLAEGKILNEGESIDSFKPLRRLNGYESKKHHIVNVGGKVTIKDGEEEERKQFARDQIAFLVSLGFTQHQAVRVMKAAGPGQMRQAVEWATEAHRALAELDAEGATDALDCVLSGARGTNQFGRERMASALSALGLPVPNCSTAKTFFGVLAGAKEALLIGLPTSN